LIFDLDGVLIDSEPLHKQAKELAFAEFGIVLSEEVYDRYKGRPDETTLREILEETGIAGASSRTYAAKACVFSEY
jgi:beta-phosphoglucomutase-like phosphatase (HAD superfamily)